MAGGGDLSIVPLQLQVLSDLFGQWSLCVFERAYSEDGYWLGVAETAGYPDSLAV